MGTEFGWWNNDPDRGKYKIRAVFHGGEVRWMRQCARFSAWEAHEPSEADREKLIDEAARRVPRRLLSPKQFEELKRKA